MLISFFHYRIYFQYTGLKHLLLFSELYVLVKHRSLLKQTGCHGV